MTDVFISYRRTERPQVERIVSALRQLELSVWFDARLSSGETFGDEINREVRKAKVVFVCWSPEAVEADWVRAEAQIGFKNKTIVSTWIAGPDNPDIPVPYNALQTEDLRPWIESPSDRHPAWRSVLRRIGSLMNRPDLVDWSDLGEDSSTRALAAWLQRYGEGSPLAPGVHNLLWLRKARADAEAEARRTAPASPPAAPAPARQGPARTENKGPGPAAATVGALWSRLFGAAGEMAIDLGTANTRIFVPNRGIVLDEPTVIAVEPSHGRPRVRAAGDEVAPLITGREDSVRTIYPVRHGVIVDSDAAEALLGHFIRKVQGAHGLPRALEVVIGTPAGATRFQRQVLRDTALAAGARKVSLIEAPLAAAIGAEMPVTKAVGSLVVDVGAGKAEIAIVSVRGRGYFESVRGAGLAMDEAISSYLARNHNLRIGEATAEAIKKEMGVAVSSSADESAHNNVRGRDLVNGVPKEISVNRRQISEALSTSVSEISEALRLALENTAPQHAADLVDQGIVLAGGVALLRGLDDWLRYDTGLPVSIAEDPLACVVKGMGRVLEDRSFRSVLFAV